MEKLCQRLKELRTENGLKQNDVAVVLKVSRVVYNRYENNQRELPLDLLVQLADFYKVSTDYLLGRTNEY